MNLLYWLAGIFIIVLIGYGVVYYLNRNEADRIKELDEKKYQMMAKPVADHLYTLKPLHSAGDTKRAYENWQATWQTVTRCQFPEIEAILLSAEQSIQQMNFVKAKKAIDDVEKLLDETNSSVEKINKA